jgi:hypothetical protein
MFILNEPILSFYSTLTHIQYRVVAAAAAERVGEL